MIIMAKLYRHYKSNLYEYIGECLHSETLEEMVKRFCTRQVMYGFNLEI